MLSAVLLWGLVVEVLALGALGRGVLGWSWGATVALGIVLAGALMALIYLGGEAAQVALQLPAAITGIFQGMLLFFLLGADAFIDNRLRRRK